MSNFEKIDKNFKVETTINKNDVLFYDPRELPFRIYGVYHEDGQYRRMPRAVAESVSEGVLALHANTAGGRIRFKTDSPYVAISLKFGDNVVRSSNASPSGLSGLDLYVKHDGVFNHKATFLPPYIEVEGFDGVAELDSCEMREILINMPSYADVKSLYIGLSDTARVQRAEEYSNERPVVYYGSSITQGGCASRTGLTYQNIISRRLNLDYINLGFSGSAKGEDNMADYLKELDMSLFVYDYDHNAPSPEHLEATHERMFLRIREANPTLPIIILSRPKYTLPEIEKRRLKTIEATYNNAIMRGDKNVYLLRGRDMLSLVGEEWSVDRIHPNDLGFYSMAKALGDFMLENGLSKL